MKLIRKINLIRRQKSAVVHCEIELCEAPGALGRYLVNLRQGRAGEDWRESTRTPRPVEPDIAERLFAQALAERQGQGFIDPEAPPVPSLDINVPASATAAPTATMNKGDAILLARFAPPAWKNLDQGQRKRTIWRVGVRRLRAVVPFLVDRIQTGDDMQDYCIAWTIGRCGDPGAAIAMRELRTRGKTDPVRRMAHQAWLMLADTPTLAQHARTIIADWPASLRDAWAAGDEAAFDALTARADQWQQLSLSDWLEKLAEVALAFPAARRLLLKRMREVPLSTGLFRAVRHIYKSAELRADAELFGIIHHRFETSPHTHGNGNWVWTSTGYMRKADAAKAGAYAYGIHTRLYLLRRSWRTLRRLGELGTSEYVDMSVGALMAMDDSTAGKRYARAGRFHDQYSHWLLFNNMLRAGGPWKSSSSGRTWYQEQPIAHPAQRDEAFAHLWDARPDALLYLMRNSQCEGVHDFAARALLSNASWCSQLPLDIMRELLRSRFQPTVRFAYLNVRQRFEPEVPDTSWLMLLLQSSLPEALEYVLSCIHRDPARYCADAALVAAVATSNHAEVRQHARLLCHSAASVPGHAESIVLQLLDWLDNCGDIDDAEVLLPAIAQDLLWLLQRPLLGAAVVAPYDRVLLLLSHRLSAVRVLACQWLLLHSAPATDLPSVTLKLLLQSADMAVRSMGVQLFSRLPDQILLEQTELIAAFCTHPDASVRRAIDALLQRLIPAYPPLRAALFPYLIDCLFRAESDEGIHADIAAWLAGPFKDEGQLHQPDLVRRLLSARSKGAQQLGALLLPRFTPAHFTVSDWAMFGRNPNVTVRQWSFAAYEANPDLVRASLEQALRIFDSRWDDSKDFASTWFAANIAHDDWTPLLLVNLCDHLDPAVQRFGRTMISTHFDVADVTEYMVKLSQHPSPNMQLFVSAWLESASAGDVHKLQRLEHYFLSVLSQVNRGRIVKTRVQAFLREQATLSEDIAAFVARLFARQVVTVAIADKAQYIEGLRAIAERFPGLPGVLTIHPPRAVRAEGKAS